MTKFLAVTTLEQAQTVAKLAGEIWRQHYTPMIGSDQVEYMLDKFQSSDVIWRSICRDGFRYYLLELSEEIVGYSGVQKTGNRLFLSKLYLLEKARGKGITGDVMDYLYQICKAENLSAIWLTCNIHNKNTLSIYHHLGFVVTDTQQADIGSGYIMDDYLLEKQID